MTEASSLMQVQELDLELLKCASSLASMPQQARLKTIALAAKKVASELTGIVGQRKDAEIEVSDTRANLAHYREKTAEVQALADEGEHTHREIRDFEQQLTSLAASTPTARSATSSSSSPRSPSASRSASSSSAR